MSEVKRSFYISTGAKNAMFTLRLCINSPHFVNDVYICNLSTDAELAKEKAKATVAVMNARLEETISLDSVDQDWLFKRRGKLSVRDTSNAITIEAGFFPFGKHAGTRIAEAPMDYVLYFADKLADPKLEPIGQILAGACMEVAIEKNYIAQRQEKRDAQREMDLLSKHVGTIGERLDITGEIVSSFQKAYEGYWINKIRVGDDIITYLGQKSLGERGEGLSLRCTIAKHEEYNGIKTTRISRPLRITQK